ncbi:LuxR family transcriptional regulator [Lentzea roselyniae]|uniref:LuxR family transcriptional regulator n=1 Tax=Lentzea roselyniae TaxID=531940 RepID=A0ABP7C555_9PSEU
MADVARFVGRRTELADLRRRLARGRLVTLHGLGGVGKTRIAAQAVEQVRRGFPDGVVFVELDGLHEPELLPRFAAERCGLTESTDDQVGLLANHLRDKNLLLVIDNCEHLADAAARLVTVLLAASAGLRVLATSRHVLGIEGEQVLRVEPFSVPEARTRAEAAELDAVSLFAQCAAAERPGFEVGEDNWAAVLDLCRRLDGIPLAIEIGAALLRLVPLPEISERVARQNPDPRRSLDSVLECSYDMCTAAEKLLWQRLSVFAGGASLEAMEEICRGDEVAAADVLGLVAGLMDKAVLHRDGSGARYRMLEIVREYGERKAEAAGELATLRCLHRDYFSSLAVRCERRWDAGIDQAWVSATVMSEHPNIRAALRFSFDTPGEGVAGLALVASLGFYWLHCGFLAEGRSWVTQALATAPSKKNRDYAKALWIDGYASYAVGDHARGDAVIPEVLEWGQVRDDHKIIGLALTVMGGGALVRGESVRAVDLYRAAIEHLLVAGNKSYSLVAHVGLLVATAFNGALGELTERARETVELADASGHDWPRAYVTFAVALARWSAGEHEDLLTDMASAVRGAENLHDRFALALLVELLAWIHDSCELYPRAAKLLGLAGRLWDSIGSNLVQGSRAWVGPHQTCRDHLEEVLGTAVFERAVKSGASHGVSIEQAVEFALNSGADVAEPERGGAQSGRGPLSKRETQVASLVAEGLTNKEIAAKLLVAPRTAQTHVDHILTKLGVESRSQIAAWVAKQQKGRGGAGVSSPGSPGTLQA